MYTWTYASQRPLSDKYGLPRQTVRRSEAAQAVREEGKTAARDKGGLGRGRWATNADKAPSAAGYAH